MNKIIVNIKPFIFKQNIYYYDNDNKLINQYKIKTTELNDFLYKLNEKEQSEINIGGNKKYSQKIQQDLVNKSVAQYGENKLIIKLI